jgi:hypothetical protein
MYWISFLSGDNAPIAIISSIECMVGFLAVSIATYRPLYRYIVEGKTSSAEASGYSGSIYNPGSRSRYIKQGSKNKIFHFGTSLASTHTGNTAVGNVELFSDIQNTGTEVRVSSRLEGATPDNF